MFGKLDHPIVYQKKTCSDCYWCRKAVKNQESHSEPMWSLSFLVNLVLARLHLKQTQPRLGLGAAAIADLWRQFKGTLRDVALHSVKTVWWNLRNVGNSWEFMGSLRWVRLRRLPQIFVGACRWKFLEGICDGNLANWLGCCADDLFANAQQFTF